MLLSLDFYGFVGSKEFLWILVLLAMEKKKKEKEVQFQIFFQ